MASSTSGAPGLTYVSSKITRPDILDVETYHQWYNEEHVPEVLQDSNCESAFRFVDANPDAERPYLTVYSTKDITTFSTEEFKGLTKTMQSDKLPGTGAALELMDFDTRFDQLVQVYDPTKKGPGHTKCIISAQMGSKAGDSAEDEEIDKWYREEHIRDIAKTPGYLRTTRYKLLYAAHVPRTAEEEDDQPPTWLALHEFETETVDLKVLRELATSEWTDKVFALSEKIFVIYKVTKDFGTRDLFHGVEI